MSRALPVSLCIAGVALAAGCAFGLYLAVTFDSSYVRTEELLRDLHAAGTNLQTMVKRASRSSSAHARKSLGDAFANLDTATAAVASERPVLAPYDAQPFVNLGRAASQSQYLYGRALEAADSERLEELARSTHAAVVDLHGATQGALNTLRKRFAMLHEDMGWHSQLYGLGILGGIALLVVGLVLRRRGAARL